MTHTREELSSHVLTLADPAEGTIIPPELYFLQAAVNALPLGDYVLHDPEMGEDDEIPGLGGLAEEPIGSWSGDQQGSLGYGDLRRLLTSQGPGLVCSLGGSSLSSALTFWILPAQLIGWMAAE